MRTEENEEKRRKLLPYLLDNASDLGLEAHVQHAVRLVKAEIAANKLS
jgi:hypothetical protein